MTAKFSNSLDNVKVASPCSQDWDAMIGSERKRYCGECKLNVYNLSGMSRTEGETLIANSEGRLCVRFFRRADGTVLTQDCPVGWRAVKMRMTKMATAFASLIFGLLGGLGLNSYTKNSGGATVGETVPVQISNSKVNSNSNFNEETPEVLMGDIAVTPQKNEIDGQWEVGKKAAPAPKKNRF